jgi:Tat protein secretion system quality control protein TatD with DNase activity
VAVAPAPEPLVDIGANLTHASFRADFDAVLDRAQKANVRAIVLTGTSPRVWCGCGVRVRCVRCVRD